MTDEDSNDIISRRLGLERISSGKKGKENADSFARRSSKAYESDEETKKIRQELAELDNLKRE